MRRLLLIISIITLSFSLKAEETPGEPARPVTGVYSFEIGRRSVMARYLAPLSYGGASYGVAGRWMKAMPFAPEKAMMEFDGRLGGALSLLNPRKNSSMQALEFEFDWNMRRWWRLPNEFTLSAGGGISIDAGGQALLKNSNNPANVNAAVALTAAGSASWTHRFGRLPAVATFQMRYPLLGAFYMPGYGETYFEMLVGNHSGLVHCGWPGNRSRVDLQLAVMLDFGKTAMEIGYRLDWTRESANRLVYRSCGNYFTIGVIPGGLGLKKGVAQLRPL